MQFNTDRLPDPLGAGRACEAASAEAAACRETFPAVVTPGPHCSDMRENRSYPQLFSAREILLKLWLRILTRWRAEAAPCILCFTAPPRLTESQVWLSSQAVSPPGLLGQLLHLDSVPRLLLQLAGGVDQAVGQQAGQGSRLLAPCNTQDHCLSPKRVCDLSIV